MLTRELVMISFAIVVGCGDSTSNAGGSNAGGSPITGGSENNGGAGGSPATGGAPATGGSAGTGGAPAMCNVDADCGDNQGCKLETGDNYCTQLCTTDAECPPQQQCAGAGPDFNPHCKEIGQHGASGVCDLYNGSYGPNTCL